MFFISMSNYVIGYIKNSDNSIVWYLFATFFLILWLIYYLIYVKKILHPRGVFSVAAIIVDDDNNILLIEDDKGFHMQPGSYYRTNRPRLLGKLETPYCKILNTIEKETGLQDIDIELIDLSYFGEKKEYTLKEALGKDVKKLHFYDKYLKHTISPPPFFIIQEYGNNKSSQEEFHIAMYYGFKLKEKKNTGKNISFRNISEFESMDVYRDLIYVYNRFITIYKKTNYPTFNIRLCRFNDKIKTVCWRLTDHCSAHCPHCFINTKLNTEPVAVNIDFESLYTKIARHRIEKLIISGGEPFLISNLPEIVENVNDSPIKKFSICTNGINFDQQIDLINEIKNYKKFDKFVISIEAYNNKKYRVNKGIKNERSFTMVLEFLHKCQSLNIPFNVNVIGNTFFLSNTERFIDFWRKEKIENITISFPVKSEENTKTDLLRKYQEIIDGQHGDVSFLKSLELIMPVCEDSNCPSGTHIFSIDKNGIFYPKCVDLIDERNPLSFVTREHQRRTVETHVAGICIKEEKNQMYILIARRKNTRKLYPGLYEGCGGQLIQGELFTDGVRRHYKCEMGVSVDVMQDIHRFYYISPENEPTIPGIVFLCKYRSGEPNSENHTDIRWITIDELKNMSDTLFIPGIKNEITTLTEEYEKKKGVVKQA